MPENTITKRCSTCKEIKKLSEFYKRKHSKDGYRYQCKECEKLRPNRKETNRNWARKNQYTEKHQAYALQYQKSDKYKKTHSNSSANYRLLHPEICKAHDTVNGAIRYGRMKKASSFNCAFCDNPAKQYHHYLGYEPEHWLDVIPLCIKCHRKIHIIFSSVVI